KAATERGQGCQPWGRARARIAIVADLAGLIEVVDLSFSSSSLPRGSLTHVCHGSLTPSPSRLPCLPLCQRVYARARVDLAPRHFSSFLYAVGGARPGRLRVGNGSPGL